MASGGKRPGAGRPAKKDKHARPIAKAEKRIADRLPELIDRMFELASGVMVEEMDAEGGVNVYSKVPDRQAAEYLINRIMGKPTERKELSGEDGGKILTELVISFGDDDAEA